VSSRLASSKGAVGLAAVVSIILALLVSWFAWPAKELEPRDLPVVVAGPPAATGLLTQQLQAARPGAFAVTVAADATAADAALRDRQAYAAFIIDPGGVSLHTASAASPTVAALLGQAATQLGGGRSTTSGEPAPAVKVVDVVSGGSADPRGAGFASGFLPIVLAGLVAGILLSLLIAARAARILGVVTFAALAGLGGAAVLAWLGIVDTYLPAAGALALLALAVSGAVAGLAAVMGRAGIAVGVLVIFLLGNPISAIAAAPELLPKPWGAVGQLLPPGAGATLLRSAAFFDWSGATGALWTLVAWAGAGLILLGVGRRSPVRPLSGELGVVRAG
jgi:hypothetical protein